MNNILELMWKTKVFQRTDAWVLLIRYGYRDGSWPHIYEANFGTRIAAQEALRQVEAAIQTGRSQYLRDWQ